MTESCAELTHSEKMQQLVQVKPFSSKKVPLFFIMQITAWIFTLETVIKVIVPAEIG